MRPLPRPCWLLLPGRFQRGSSLGTACPVPGPPCQPGILSSPGFPSPLDREKGHQWTGLRGFQAPGRCGAGRVASPGERKRFCGQCFSLVGPQGSPLPLTLGPLHTHTPLLHNWPISGLRSSNRSSSGAASSCRTGRGFLFRSFLSFPMAKIFWSLCFSFSRSPVKAQKWLNYGVKGTPIHGLCS